eukprot:296256-Chlamydomonas_euryale.AAC.2
MGNHTPAAISATPTRTRPRRTPPRRPWKGGRGPAAASTARAVTRVGGIVPGGKAPTIGSPVPPRLAPCVTTCVTTAFLVWWHKLGMQRPPRRVPNRRTARLAAERINRKTHAVTSLGARANGGERRPQTAPRREGLSGGCALVIPT